MGFQIDYVETIKQVEEMIQIMFEKLSRCCKYGEPTLVRRDMISPIPNTCLYYGREEAQRCEREDCPLLEEEE